MAINIKKPEVEAMARELAELTGQSLTSTVETALRELLERWRAEQRRQGMHEAIMEISHETAARWNSPLTSTSHGDFLYDETTGLPR